MKGCLAIDVFAVDVDFIVSEQSDDIVDVAVDDGVEQDVAANLFHPTYHFQINN